MKMSTRSQYGLRAMTYLALNYKNKKATSLRKISRSEGISLDYLEKIIALLRDAKLVKAKRGIRGGYFLARSPKKITVAEIVRVLEGTLAPVLCVAEEKEKKYHCPRAQKCLTKNVWQKTQESLGSTLGSITLSDLI